MATPNWLVSDSSQSSSSSFVSTEGAGSSATATSTNGVNGSQTTNSQQIYTPGATSSSGSAIATSSPQGATVSTSVAAPNPDPSFNTSPIHSTNLITDVPPDSSSVISSPDSSSISTIAISPILISASSFSKQFHQDGKFVRGHRFNDVLRGGRHNDQLWGDRGHDHLWGKGGNDWVTGGSGNDTLRGGRGDDWLAGGEGNDTLVGNLGQDWLTGDGGADRFVLSKGVIALNLADVITDFNAAQGDVIQVAKGRASRAETLKNIVFEVFDSDGNGIFDATLIRSDNNRIQAIVLNTVNASGTSTLTYSNLTTLS